MFGNLPKHVQTPKHEALNPKAFCVHRSTKMFATAVRWMGRKSKTARDKRPSANVINPQVIGDEAFKLSAQLQAIIKEFGPLSVRDFWERAKEIEGLPNKRSMKVMLHWMVSRHHCKLICTHQSNSKSSPVKEFFFAEWVPRPGQKGGPPLEVEKERSGRSPAESSPSTGTSATSVVRLEE